MLVVRHPAERILSAYLNKFLNPKSRSWRLNNKNSLRIFKYFNESESITFHQFITYLAKSSLENLPLDEHWTPMSELCSFSVVDYNIIVPLNKLEDTLTEMSAQFGIPEAITNKILVQTSKTDSIKLVKDYFGDLDSQLKYAFYKKFEDDHTFLGYEPYL
ncbi:carbohydrate sulfotransferase 12-like [Octopus sinensis]|uniref:Carbohydrate sulfotransferase n=1 Tax=Octopus sinensis TaxID=2607531 RepID=A0A6P7U9D5_9MOLL|nr:carbohydrate sulfotransferase 12-like [Octopus sinensis]